MPAATRIWLFSTLFAVSGLCGASDDAETVYRKLHEAALAQDLEQVRRYAAQAQQAELTLPVVPKTYRITGKAERRDGRAVELRATGTADSVGLGYTQLFGVIGLVKENGAWKVERLSWTTGRPGEYPEGYVIVQGDAPAPRRDSTQPRFALPPSAPEPSHLVTKRPDETKPPPAQERPSKPCVIKPVMSDDELRACGAEIPE